jgi:hypothetical protein
MPRRMRLRHSAESTVRTLLRGVTMTLVRLDDVIATIADAAANDTSKSLKAWGVSIEDRDLNKLRDYIADAIRLEFKPSGIS